MGFINRYFKQTINTQPSTALFYSTPLICLIFSLTVYSAATIYELSFFDSWTYIVLNECIRGINLENISCIFSQTYFSNWQPVTLLSYMLEHPFFGFHGQGYHTTNIILHAVNSYLFFLILIKLTQYRLATYRLEPKLVIACTFTLLVFICHPQRVESVAWVAERKGLLAFLFLSLSFLCYHSLKTRLKTGWKISAGFYIFFLLAILSKATAITFPFFLILMDRFFYREDKFWENGFIWEFRTTLESIKGLLVPMVLSVATIYINFLAQGTSVVSTDNIDIASRVLNVLHNSFFYILKFLNPSSLHPYYLTPSAIENKNFVTFAIYAMLFISTFVITIYWSVKRSSIPLLLWLSHLVFSVTIIGVLQVGSQIAADRYAYLTTTPFYFGLNYAVYWILSQKIVLLRLSLPLLILLLFFKAKTQVTIWKDDFIMWKYVMEKSEGGRNYRAEYALGDTYKMVGETEESLKYYGMATEDKTLIIYKSYLHYIDLLVEQKKTLEAYSLLLHIIYGNESTKDEINECWKKLDALYLAAGNIEDRDKVKRYVDHRLK